MRSTVGIAFLCLLAGCSSSTRRGLSGDDATARETIEMLAAKGQEAVPELTRLSREDDDPVVRRRAKTALGRITGQWGGDGRLMWKRSTADAENEGRPILVLQLFGEFDQEFC